MYGINIEKTLYYYPVDMQTNGDNKEIIVDAIFVKDNQDDSEIERDDNNNITSIKVSTKFIGTKEDPHQANSIIQQLLRSTYLDSEFLNLLSQEKGWYWYRLDKTDLDKMGLNNIDLDNEAYLVNYYDLDVAYCKTTLDDSNRYKGIKSKQKNGETKYVYFYEGLKNLKTDEMSN